MKDTAPNDTGSAPSTALAPLRNATFRSVWLSTQVSGLGWLIQTVAVSWLMLTISASDVLVALVQAAASLPAFILSIFAGAIADNFSHRAVMLVGRCLIAAAFAILTMLLAAGVVDPWTILGLSFLAGCGVALTSPAWQASVSDIVDRADVPAAVLLISAGFNTIRSIGPALGGILVASFGALPAMVFATIASIVPLWVLWRRTWEVRPSPFPRESLTTAIYDGLRFTAMSSDLKAAIVRGTLLGVAGSAVLALLPLLVRDQLGGGAIGYGVLMAGFGAGAVLAGVGNGILRRKLSPERLITFACMACALCSASLAVASSLAAATIALVVGGAGWVAVWSELGVSVQLASPRWVVGRILSIYYAGTSGGIAAGSWLWGAVTESYSLTWALGGSAAALLLVIVTGYLMPIQGSDEADLDPAGSLDTPPLAYDLKPRSGPIVVRIEYSISQDDLGDFLCMMPERRRGQSRAGARNWNLQRDLQDLTHWIETFRTPTWSDYLRLNHRLTTADWNLNDRLASLHAGHCPPRPVLTLERSSTAERKVRLTRLFFPHV